MACADGLADQGLAEEITASIASEGSPDSHEGAHLRTPEGGCSSSARWHSPKVQENEIHTEGRGGLAWRTLADARHIDAATNVPPPTLRACRPARREHGTSPRLDPEP